MAESPPAQSQLSQAAPTAPQIHNAKNIEPSPEIEHDLEGAKPFKGIRLTNRTCHFAAEFAEVGG